MGGFLFFSIIIFVLIVPVYVQADFYFDLKIEKIGCNFRLYGLLNIAGGYFAPYKGGFAWHISERKAKLIPIKKKKKKKDSSTKIKPFRIQKIKCVWETDPQYLLPLLWLDNLSKLIGIPNRQGKIQSQGTLNNDNGFRVFLQINFQTALWRILPKIINK